MEFITFTDNTGKQWVLNKAFIAGMSPTFGGDAWERGAQIHIAEGALDRPTITISGDSVAMVRLALGAAL